MSTYRVHIATILGCVLIAPACHAQCLARWWAMEDDLGSYGLAIWDPDGAGQRQSELVAGFFMFSIPGQGNPTEVRRYDGRAWRPVGERLWGPFNSTAIYALTPAETSGDGSPEPGLYAAGRFDRTSFEPARNIARFDGTRWRPVGQTISGYALYSLAMFDEDGPGPGEANLFVGGTIVEVAGIADPGIVRWDGTTYTQLGGGLLRSAGTNPTVKTMLVFDDDGPGPNKPALYVAGSFDYAGAEYAPGVARWTGTRWETLGDGLGYVQDLAVFDADGGGPEPPMLYAGGGFSAKDPQGNPFSYIARWTGTHWEGIPGYLGAAGVSELGVFDPDGDGPEKASLIVSGFFRLIAGQVVNYIARWDGADWHAMGSGLAGLSPSWAVDMQVFDEDGDPSTPDGLYVGGNFFYAGGLHTVGLARWGCENPICYADCDESSGLGKLDIFDFLCFQQSFVTNDPYACNCDTSTGHGICDIFDFLCFQDAFVAGCM